MEIILIPLIQLALSILDVIYFIIIGEFIMNWLVFLGIANVYNQTFRKIYLTLKSVTEPMYRRIRTIIPPMGNIDFSPLVAIILIQFIKNLIMQIIYKMH